MPNGRNTQRLASQGEYTSQTRDRRSIVDRS